MGAVANLLFAISCRSFQNTKDHTTIRKLKYDHIQEAISLSPRLWLAHYCLGDWYEGSQKWLDAKAEFERAVKLQPDAAAAHYHLGAVLDILHNKDLALKQFELAVKFSRHDDSDEIYRESKRKVEYFKEIRDAAKGKLPPTPQRSY